MEHSMNNTISRIVSDLLAKSVEGKDASSDVRQLGDELQKIVQRDDTLYGKFRGILDSFRTIIPDEQQRYLAALQALSTTAKLSRQEVMKAISSQQEELSRTEQGLTPYFAAWRDTIKAMEARQQAIQSELVQLRERIAQLENEDRTIISLKVSRELSLGQAEKTIRDIFANIGAEMAAVNKTMGELPAEASAGQPAQSAAQPGPPVAQPPVQPVSPPAPPAVQAASVTNAAPVEKKAETPAASAPVDTKFQKKCPMCGGQFNLLELQKLWQCFTCGYEEPAKNA